MEKNHLNKHTRAAIRHDLSCLCPGFAAATTKQQSFILKKVSAWLLKGKNHQHNKTAGAFFIYCKERQKHFRLASDFKKATAGIIDCVKDQYYSQQRSCKAYESTEQAKQIILKHMTDNKDKPVMLEGRNGNAIVSRDINDNKPACKGNLKLMQPVNRPAVEKLLSTTANKPHTDANERIIFGCLGVLNNSNFKGHSGQMPNRYREAISGRIVGLGLNLQNVKREVKNAALADQYDHDIVNCHINFTAQLGKSHGLGTDSLDWYNSIKTNTDKTELIELASLFTDNPSDFKRAMLALIYGAPLNSSHGAIKDILNEYASDFINHTEIKELSREAADIRACVIANAPARRGQLINHLNKPLELANESVTIKTKYAHILHGLEAQMLHHAISLYGDQISLLSHDGFVTKQPIDTAPLTALFEQSTGLVIDMKTEQLAA